jgi:tetratricopeptide (TPR) repeat protein
MRFLKEFSYPDIFQRRIILTNAFFSFLLLSLISFHCAVFLASYSPYEPVMKSVLLAVLMGLLAGNLAGKAVFRIPGFRVLFMVTELVFLVLSALYFSRWDRAGTPEDPVLALYFTARPWFMIGTGMYAFFPGLALNYYLKVFTGDYIDEKRPIYAFSLILAIAPALGAAASLGITAFPLFLPAGALFILFILPTIFLIKTPYAPEPIMVQHFKDSAGDDKLSREEVIRRDDLFFTYLNSSYILIYSLLAFESIIRFAGTWPAIQVFFFIILLASLTAGFLCARIVGSAFWHIYTEMIFPAFFILMMVLAYTRIDHAGPAEHVLYCVPLAMVLGFSLFHTLRNIMQHYDHGRRFLILDFSLFVLPFPIVLVFAMFQLTTLWFFVLVYAVALLNILFPGIHLMQRAIAGYKKLVYFAFSISFIPLIIFVHLYFAIPLNDRLYIEHTAGFESLQGINTNQEHIRQAARVLYNGREIFTCSDSIIKNLQRAVLTVLFFSNDSEMPTRPVLVLDGTQSFYRNPVLGYFNAMRCVDYVSDRSIDYHRLPVSGRQGYSAEKSDLYSFLFQSNGTFETICDIPNLYDQGFDTLRFSKHYYSLVKRRLSEGGLYAQVFSVTGCRPEHFSAAYSAVKTHFAHSAIFLFSDTLLVIASDRGETLSLTRRGVDRIRALQRERSEIASMALNEYHVLSHYYPADADSFLQAENRPAAWAPSGGGRHNGILLDEQAVAAWLSGSTEVLALTGKNPADMEVSVALQAGLGGNPRILELLKKTELAGARKEYEAEADFLSQLRTLSEYSAELRAYIIRLLTFKEELYFSEAIKFEKVKKWEEASRLYRAMLRINQANFEACYRMGILSITLQNLDDAFKYLQRAMELKRDDPKVLYQMGVLQFSSGQTRQALEYFAKALELRESPESVYNYMGMCYEKLGRLDEAKTNYEKARLADPNDSTIQASLERINQLIQARRIQLKPQDRKNQFEAEQGETMPLPINQTAKDIRLKDNEVPPEEPEKPDKTNTPDASTQKK